MVFQCSKSTIETLEKGVKKCSKLTTKNARATSAGVFIDSDDFEDVNSGWVRSSLNDNYTYSTC